MMEPIRWGASSAKGATLAVALGLLLTGCGGDNLFEPHQPVEDEELPEIQELSLPNEVTPGTMLTVEVHATGPNPVERVEGEMTLGDDTESDVGVPTQPATDVTVTLQFPVPEFPTGDVATVTVRAVDETSAESSEVSGEVPVADGP